MPCVYCEGGNECYKHVACVTELMRRMNDGDCTRCGAKSEQGEYLCSGCMDMNDPPYVGYPGGL